jgi:hypothetical protein
MRNAAVGERRSASEFDEVFDVGWTHHSRVEHTDIFIQLVELDILLRERVKQIMELQAGDRQYRLAVELGVVQSVEQVNPARTRCGDTDTEPTGPFGVGARVEGRRLFMPHLNEMNLILVGAECFDDSVDAISGKAKDSIDIPFDESFDEKI